MRGCVCVYLAGSVARLLYELSNAVDVLRNVQRLDRVILQLIQLCEECGNGGSKFLHYRERERGRITLRDDLTGRKN